MGDGCLEKGVWWEGELDEEGGSSSDLGFRMIELRTGDTEAAWRSSTACVSSISISLSGSESSTDSRAWEGLGGMIGGDDKLIISSTSQGGNTSRS